MGWKQERLLLKRFTMERTLIARLLAFIAGDADEVDDDAGQLTVDP